MAKRNTSHGGGGHRNRNGYGDLSKTEVETMLGQIERREQPTEEETNELYRIASAVASKYSKTPWARVNQVSLDDLRQEAVIGALAAFRGFDPSKGLKLDVRVWWLACNHVQHYLRDKAALIRVPKKLYESGKGSDRIVESLDRRLEGADDENWDTVEDESAADPADTVAERDDLMRRIPNLRDREVFLEHYLEGLTLSEIARRHATSEPAVGKRLEKIRAALHEETS